MSAPGQRRPGQSGGAGGRRSNKGTFRAAGGRVPPPPKRPTVSGKVKSGCAMVVAVPVLIALAIGFWACH
jgi:hypothetical protein